MRYTLDHKRQTRERVLHAAARALRRLGPAKVAVADVMRDAGLTHGGFYAHFASREELVALAIEQMFIDALGNFEKITAGKTPHDAMRDYVRFYLSRSHWAQRETGCPLAALATDVPRLGEDGRAHFESGTAQLAGAIAGCLAAMGRRDPGALAISILSELVGALTLARAVTDEGKARNMLKASRAQLLDRLALT